MIIKNSKGEKLDYTLHPGTLRTLVVLGHGVTGNKDRPFLVALSEALSAEGIPVLRFSFSGNGDSEGKFEDSCITKEVDDLGSVLDAVAEDYENVCYAGHSMGGAVGVVRAAKDERISLLISLAGMVATADFAEREFGKETPGKGFMWEDEDCPLSVKYMEDMKKWDNVAHLAKRIMTPWLFVHGNEDDVVPLQDSAEIFAQADDPKLLEVIDGGDHVFSGEESTQKAIKVIIDWLKLYLEF